MSSFIPPTVDGRRLASDGRDFLVVFPNDHNNHGQLKVWTDIFYISCRCVHWHVYMYDVYYLFIFICIYICLHIYKRICVNIQIYIRYIRYIFKLYIHIGMFFLVSG